MKTPSDAPELYRLARPINQALIEPPAQGKYGHYVPHFVVTQILLATTGPFDQRVTYILRGTVPGFKSSSGREWPTLEDAVVGATVIFTFTVDGQRVDIEEAGACDATAAENNDAQRLKRAISDALKRAAMRLGLGTHLWCRTPRQVIQQQAMDAFEAADPEHAEAVLGSEEALVSGVGEDDPERPFE